ncbi:unnamed protein product [Prorocentrum cordatum]|uniref:RNase H type-1 domain-containing protein n=1 Tax=Prorocentrum cordatum TaxID=2364126 RepID=A0ABN9UP10_9DINO|nr:unnamed protein product [Polarella glacialis]
MVDPSGRLIAAAYGAGPVDICPQQASHDAEDYAIFMLTSCAFGPVEVYADCASTLQCLHDPVFSVSAQCSNAHLWQRMWHIFHDPGMLSAFKTKAHCTQTDVEACRTTAWERLANESADSFAKQGAGCHPCAAAAARELAGLNLLAVEAGRWAAQQEILKVDRVWLDADQILPYSPPEPPAPNGPLDRSAALVGKDRYLFSSESPPAAPELELLVQLQGHRIKMAPVFQADGQPVLSGSRVAI